MEKMAVMQINIENEGWNTVLLTQNTQPLDYMIKEVMGYNEYVQIRIGVIFDDRLVPVMEFDNEDKKKKPNVAQIYNCLTK